MAAAVAGICVLTFVLIGAQVAHGQEPTRLDGAFWNILPWPWTPAGEHGLGHYFLAAEDQVRQLGGPLATVLLTALLCYCCLAMRRYRAAILVAGGEVAASALTEFMKPIFDRTIGGSLSYPSGHTTAAFALGVAIVLITASSRDSRMPMSMRIVLSVITLATAASVGIGMVAWHQHYLTDAVGGAAVGIGVPLAVALLTDFLAESRRHATARTLTAEPEPTRQLR